MTALNWKHLRMRAESNIAFGVLLLLLALLIGPFEALTATLAGNAIGPAIIAIGGVAAYAAVARRRQQGADTVYGLNSVATALIVYGLVMLLSPARTQELARTLASSQLLLVAVGVALIVMGYFLRRNYARREVEEPPEEPAVEPSPPEEQGPDAA